MSCLVENTENDRQYVHITGNAFILVPFSTNTRPRPRTATNVVRRNTGQKRYPVHPDQSSPHEAYITRHVGGKKDDHSTDRKVSNLIVYLNDYLNFHALIIIGVIRIKFNNIFFLNEIRRELIK